MAVIDNLAPSKNKRIKGTSQNQFDAEIMEKLSDRDKLFKKSRLHVDKENYKEAKNEVQKLIRTKKKAYFKSKLTENVGKPKELWNCLKSLGLECESANALAKPVTDICNLSISLSKFPSAFKLAKVKPIFKK